MYASCQRVDPAWPQAVEPWTRAVCGLEVLPCQFVVDCVRVPPLEFIPLLVNAEVVEETFADCGLALFVCVEFSGEASVPPPALGKPCEATLEPVAWAKTLGVLARAGDDEAPVTPVVPVLPVAWADTLQLT